MTEWKYAIGEIVIYRDTLWTVEIRRIFDEGRLVYTLRCNETGVTATAAEDEPGLYLHEPAPIPYPETIPGDRDGDYPVTEKGIMAVAIPFAMAGVVMYAVVKLIWR